MTRHAKAKTEEMRLSATFAALSDPTRRRILERLATAEASVNDLTALFQLTQPTISKHLQVLERAGIISSVRDAQRRVRRLAHNSLMEATAWMLGYQNPGTLHFSTNGDRDIEMKRAFWAPRESVFEAFVDPTLLKRWFHGKPGVTLAVCKIAAKAGESFRYLWRDSSGHEIGMQGVCLEFKRPERIVATEQFDTPWYPGTAVGTIDLKQYDDVTVLTHTIRYASRVARDTAVASGMEHAIAMGYDRLETLLSSPETKKRRHK